MLSKSIDPTGMLEKRDAAIINRNSGEVAATTARAGMKGGATMVTMSIDPAGTLSEREFAVLKAKLGNPDGISAVPVKVEGNALCIGVDDRDFVDDWEFIGRRLGYRVHTV